MMIDQDYCPICGIDFHLIVKHKQDSFWEIHWYCQKCNLKVELVTPIEEDSFINESDNYGFDKEDLEDYSYLVSEFVQIVGKPSTEFFEFVLCAIKKHAQDAT